MDKPVEVEFIYSNGYYRVTVFANPDEFMLENSRNRFVLISKKDADKIISYDEVVGFDPKTGEAIWEEVTDPGGG